MKANRKRLRLVILPLISLLLAVFIAVGNLNLINTPDSVTTTYLRSAAKGDIGYGEQGASGNKISFARLEPGDILLGGWPHCAYGKFSHSGLYLGDNKVLEGYVDSGITINHLEHYNNYAWACILRVKAEPEIRRRAIDYALRQEGKMFFPVAFKNGERYWNCSKIVWKAYMEQGINLDSFNDIWIAPDVFCSSPHIEIISQTRR